MKFAKSWKRIIAYIIDCSLLIIFLSFIYVFLLRDMDIVNSVKDTFASFFNGTLTFEKFINVIYDLTNKQTFLLFLYYLLYCFIYFVFMPMIFPFQTLGRFLMGIKVVKLNDTHLSFGTLFLREILGKGLFVFFSFGIVAIVSFILMFTSRSGRCIHDRCANTVVVEASRHE